MTWLVVLVETVNWPRQEGGLPDFPAEEILSLSSLGRVRGKCGIKQTVQIQCPNPDSRDNYARMANGPRHLPVINSGMCNSGVESFCPDQTW